MTDRTMETQINGGRRTARIPIVTTGISIGAFLAITFALCVIFDLIVPSMAMREAWMVFLPGFTWLSIPSFLLGLLETFAYGFYVAIVFGSVFNFVTARFERRA